MRIIADMRCHRIWSHAPHFQLPPSLPSFPLPPWGAEVILACLWAFALLAGIHAALVHYSCSISWVSWAANTQICEREGGGRYRGRGCVGATAAVVAVFNLNLPLPPRMLILALNLLISDCDRDWRTCQFSRAVATHTHTHTSTLTHTHQCTHVHSMMMLQYAAQRVIQVPEWWHFNLP